MEVTGTKDWIVRQRPTPHAALRLLCFSHAGGSAAAFRAWPDALPADVDVWAIELPGHGHRMKEPPFQRLAPLMAALVDAVAPVLEAPFAVYGHSLGALVGFEFARELRRRAHPGPAHVFVSGRRPPQIPERSPMHHLPEQQFVDRLRRLGGIPDLILQEPEMMALFLPILRADFMLSETSPHAPEPPLECPITALSGRDDERVGVGELDAWRVQTRASFASEIFPGGHFFIHDKRLGFLSSLARRLSQITATSSSRP